MSEELHEEKLQFASNAYNAGKQFVQNQVAACFPELDLSFLDEDLEPEEADAGVLVDTSASGPSTTAKL